MAILSKTWNIVFAATGVVALFTFIKAYRYVRKYRNVFKEIGLYELPYKGWLGAWSLWTARKDNLFELEINLIREHGKVFGYFEGRYPCIMIADADMLRQVMIKDQQNFVDRRSFSVDRKRPGDYSLTILTGAHWKHVRQQITPAFTPANLRRMEPLVRRVAEQLSANIGRMADAHKPFDAKEYCGYFSLDAVASVAFAMDIDSFNTQDSPFVSNAKSAFTIFPFNGAVVTTLLLFPGPIGWLLSAMPLLPMLRFFQDVISDEIDRRHKEESKRYDFLAQVLHLEKDPNDPENAAYVEKDELGGVWVRNGLTRDQIIGQSVLFFIAGYETTGSTLSLCILALSQNPDIQERLYNQLHDAFGGGKEMSGDALNEVNYLEMVINETLRCYAPVLRVDRLCTSDTDVNGIHIPKGVVVTIPVNAVHHDPDYWPEPDKFDPERFSKENADSFPQNAFIPFGAGNRNCIGMRLAMMELKIGLARVVLDYKFKLSPEIDLPIRWQPTAFRTPHCKLLLQAERRSS